MHVQVAGRAVAVEVERHQVAALRERHLAHLAARQLGQGHRVAGIVIQAYLDAAVAVDHADAVAAVARIAGAQQVPVGFLDVARRAAGQVIGPDARELAFRIAREQQALRRRVERLGRMTGRLLVRRDVLHRARLHVIHIDVAVRRRGGLVEGQPVAVAADARDVHAAVVLVHHRARIGGGVVQVQIEELRIALVGDDVEAAAVRLPARERGFQLVARREITFFSVEFTHIQVVLLVAAAIAREQDAVVVVEVADGVGGVGLRRGQRARLAAADGQRVGIEDAGLVTAEQDLLLVLAERGAGERGRRHELLDRVAFDGLSARLGRHGLGKGLHRRQAGAGEHGEQGQTDSTAILMHTFSCG